MTMKRTIMKNKKAAKKKEKTKKSNKRLKKDELVKAIVEIFNSFPNETFNYRQISNRLGITNQVQKLQIVEILYSLSIDNFISEIDKGRYRYNNWGTTVIGTFTRRQNGKNSFIPEDGGAPILIAERNSAHALDGDKVKIQLRAKRKGAEPEGEVIEILEKNSKPIVGVLQLVKGFAFLITEDKTLSNDIFIPKENLKNGKSGDKAVVRIIEWPEDAKNPIGIVIDILGKSGNNDVEMNAILADFGLPYNYPENVEKAANKISDVITQEEISLREDFRETTTFTIDPRDAKDFDDALSIKQLDNENWEVGVHIADVTHYVKPESLIDREAYKRATSVYLVDRTIPMLPERLCNQLCSLRPNEEKLCFSVIFEINSNADIVHSRIVRTIIKSNRRFTYEEAQNIIETKEGDYKEEILALNDIAQKIREKRFKNGAIAFDRYEIKFEIDEKGKPISTYLKISKEAHKLIEEFMLMANQTVAEFIGKNKNKTKKTFVYRVHDQPDPDRLRDFSIFIGRFGYKMNFEGTKKEVTNNLNKLLNNVKGKPEENLIETIAIRSMQKAHYTTDNIGHYGLAMDHYTHFTSPIRRYPDMMVHRLLERYLAGGRSVVKNKYDEYCKHCSNMETLAASAERASIKYKQVEFLKDKVGQVFDGVVSGVTDWGLYVELNENKCEGLVPIRDLKDDFYEFDEKNYCLIGRRTKQIYRLGDAITIKIAQANLERKLLDFTIV
ncbi:MAG: ribonuclease R [Parabacteroides sp.]|nr:ribonuclease R [Parabacteroides sp.]